MKKCQNCGANIEGLLYQCDCCGASLSNTAPVFVQYLHTVAGTGDLADYLKKTLDALNSSDVCTLFFPLETIAFEIHCFPENMVCEFHIKNKNYISIRQKRAILTRLVCYETFVCATQKEKMSIIAGIIKEGLIFLCNKLNMNNVEKSIAEIDHLL
jgi:hypothetical protein